MGNDDYRAYDWLFLPLVGCAFGVFWAIMALRFGSSATVAWFVGVLTGIGVSVLLGLDLLVQHRYSRGVTIGRPERVRAALSASFDAYGRFNRVFWYVWAAVTVLLLVWLALRGS